MLIFTELGDFVLGFPHGRGRGLRLADGFPLNLVSQTQSRAVTRIIRLGAMTSRFATATHDACDRTRTKVAEPGKLSPQLGTLLFKIG